MQVELNLRLRRFGVLGGDPVVVAVGQASRAKVTDTALAKSESEYGHAS